MTPNNLTNSFNNRALLSKSSLTIIDHLVSEKNFDTGANQNQLIGNTYTLIDNEFLKKSQDENINRLKSEFILLRIMNKNLKFLLFFE